MKRQNAMSMDIEPLKSESLRRINDLTKKELLETTLSGRTKTIKKKSSKKSENENIILDTKNKLETIQTFFSLPNPFYIPLLETSDINIKKKFIEMLINRIKENNLIIYDINQKRKGNIENIELNNNIILYKYANETEPRKMKINDFINNIYYNNSEGKDIILLSFEEIPIHLKEFSNKDDIYLHYKNIEYFFKNIIVSSMTGDKYSKYKSDLDYSIKKKSDIQKILLVLHQISDYEEKIKKLDEIIDEIKKIEISNSMTSLIRKYQDNYNYLLSTEKIEIKINEATKKAKLTFLDKQAIKKYYLSASNVLITDIINPNSFNVKIILNKDDISNIEKTINETYDVIRKEILNIMSNIDSELMPSPAKKIKITGGKNTKKMRRKIYINNKGKQYIKYDKNTIIYLSF